MDSKPPPRKYAARFYVRWSDYRSRVLRESLPLAVLVTLARDLLFQHSLANGRWLVFAYDVTWFVLGLGLGGGYFLAVMDYYRETRSGKMRNNE